MPMMFAAALAAAATTGAAAPAPACTARLCYADNIGPFLDTLAASKRTSGRPVHILQIGDSHTAGDMFTNGWRTVLQSRYGFGGRGVLAAGRPYPGVITFGVTQAMSPGWTVNANFGKAWNPAGAAIGIAGFSLTTTLPGETMGVTSDTPDQNFDRITLCALRQPGGGAVTIRFGTKVERFDLAADEARAECRTVDSEWRVSSAQVTTDGPGIVTLTSFATFARQGGVVLSNLGVSGSQLVHLARESDRVIAAELDAWRPDLIVLAFGTNEGFSQSLTPDRFEEDLRSQVRRIRRLAGRKVPIMLIGAPDANTNVSAIARNYGSPQPCPNAGGTPGIWYTPTLLGAVRERQRQVAHDMDLAFWDWSAAMGGLCSAMAWRSADPPLMRGDHVHFTRAGGARLGAILFGDVEAALAAPRRQ